VFWSFHSRQSVLRFCALHCSRPGFRNLLSQRIWAVRCKPGELKGVWGQGSRAAEEFIGRHDFTQFANVSPDGTLRDPFRTISSFDVVQSPDSLRIEVSGSGFLYKQVRPPSTLPLTRFRTCPRNQASGRCKDAAILSDYVPLFFFGLLGEGVWEKGSSEEARPGRRSNGTYEPGHCGGNPRTGSGATYSTPYCQPTLGTRVLGLFMCNIGK
jgi:tRNA pseudouridine synthase